MLAIIELEKLLARLFKTYKRQLWISIPKLFKKILTGVGWNCWMNIETIYIYENVKGIFILCFRYTNTLVDFKIYPIKG